jgi:hypothetical protein
MNAPHDLEAAYRRRLRAYPRRWREQNGEELLAVLLTAAEGSRRSRPSPTETLDLLRNGLSARARRALRPFSPLLRGRIASLSLTGGASMGRVCLLFGELPAIGGPHRQVSYQAMITFPPLLTVAPLLYLGFLVTLALTVAGRLRPSRSTGLILLTLSAVVTLTSLAARSYPVAAPPLHLSLFFIAVSLLTCVGRVDLSRNGRWLLALGAAGLAGARQTPSRLPWPSAPSPSSPGSSPWPTAPADGGHRRMTHRGHLQPQPVDQPGQIPVRPGLVGD